MDARQFFNLVSRLREAQKRYFKTRLSIDLQSSKQLEKELDAEIERVNTIIQQKQNPILIIKKEPAHTTTPTP